MSRKGSRLSKVYYRRDAQKLSNTLQQYLNRTDLCKQYSPTLFAILSRGFFRIALSEKTAAISTGNCLKV